MVKAVERARDRRERHPGLRRQPDRLAPTPRAAEGAAGVPRRLAELGIAPVAIHASYLVNLAGPDEQFHAASIEVLANELRVAPGFRRRFVNVHVGSHRGDGVAAGRPGWPRACAPPWPRSTTVRTLR